MQLHQELEDCFHVFGDVVFCDEEGVFELIEGDCLGFISGLKESGIVDGLCRYGITILTS